MDQVTFDNMLINMGVADNETRKNAEAHYNQLRESNTLWVMHALTETCATTTNPALPPLAIILLRKLFARSEQVFDNADPEVRKAIKGRLLEVFGQSADKPHSRSVAACISALAAKIVAIGDTWDELWVNLFATLQNPSLSAHRGVCCEVLNHTATVLATTYLKGHMRELASGLQMCLTDPNVEVKKSALSALQSVTQILDKSDLVLFRPLVGTILTVVQDSLNNQDWVTTKALFLALTECIEHSIDLFNDHVMQVLQATMQVGSSPLVPKEVRHLASEAMLTFCEANPKAIKKTQGFSKALFELLFQYIMNPEIPSDWDTTRDDPDAADLEGVTDMDVGCTSLDRLATAMPAKQLQTIAQDHFMQNISSPNWQNRNAALIMLTYVSEGLRQVFAEHLGSILQFVIPTVNDEHKMVRYSAVQCLSQFSCDFAPELQTQFHEQVVPVLRGALHDPIPRNAANAAAAMNSFFDNAEDGDDDESAVEARLAPYVHDCCVELVHVYNNASTLFVKGDCLGALSSVISTCKSALTPYVNDLVPLFQGVLAMQEDDSQTGKEIRIMKCKAVECTTLLACGVGKVHFSAYAHPVCEYLNSILSTNLTNDDPRLRYILRGWTCMVECLKEDVLPYLPAVVPPLLAVANMDCDLEIVSNEVGDEEEEEEEGVEKVRLALKGLGEQTVKIKTSLIEDKELAMTIIMSIMGELKGKLAPYLPQITSMAIACLSFCATSDVRENAAEIISELVDAYTEAAPAEIPNLVRNVAQHLLTAIKDESEISTMGQELTALTKVLDSQPNVLVETEVRTTAEVIHLVFKDSIQRRKDLIVKKASEQDEEEQEAIDDEDETEQFLLTECISTLQALLRNCNSYFLPLFVSEFLPILNSLTDPAMDHADNTTALTGYCDFVEFGARAALEHIPVIAPAMLRFSSNEHPDVCQAACYGLGLIAELCAATFPQPHAESTQFATTAVNALAGYLSNAKAKKAEFEDCTCNVISSSLKLIDKFGGSGAFDATRFFQQVLVFLPVGGDVVEGQRAHERLLMWVVQGHPMLAAVPSAKQMIISALKKAPASVINDATRQQLALM